MRRAPKASVTGKPPEGGLSHLSYSSHSTGLDCLKRLQLSRIQKAPQVPSWWFVGGKAVHVVTEMYDRWSLGLLGKGAAFNLPSQWAAAFQAEIEESKAVEPDDSKWRSGKERYREWNVVGPEMVQRYIDWRRRTPYEIWITPDGQPAIELDVSGYLPGCGLEIKAYLDRVVTDPVLSSMAVTDIKSGKTKPKSPLQFGVYSALMTVKYGVTPDWGAAWMGRDGVLGTPYSLAKYTPEYVGRLLGNTERIVQQGAFSPNLGDCYLCDVKDACYAMDGPLADRYDPDSPGYAVPF